MTNLTLPEPITDYFAAERRDGAAVARCFTRDGTVIDEGQRHAGSAAIEAWKTTTSSRFSYTVEPLSYEQKPTTSVVMARVTGSFPGGPAVLKYTFTLVRGKISALEIAL